MEIEDFSYLRCISCGYVIIVPISYNDNHTLLSNMCHDYSELSECCDDADIAFASVRFGIEGGYIKVSDLPFALRKEFPPEVTHEFDCGKHSLVVTKHNGDKVTVSVNSNNVMITDTYATTIVYVMDD